MKNRLIGENLRNLWIKKVFSGTMILGSWWRESRLAWIRQAVALGTARQWPTSWSPAQQHAPLPNLPLPRARIPVLNGNLAHNHSWFHRLIGLVWRVWRERFVVFVSRIFVPRCTRDRQAAFCALCTSRGSGVSARYRPYNPFSKHGSLPETGIGTDAPPGALSRPGIGGQCQRDDIRVGFRCIPATLPGQPQVNNSG